MRPLAQLVICVIGIYASFLVWALIYDWLWLTRAFLVSTTSYQHSVYPTKDKFRSFLFLNTVQSFFSALSALIFLQLSRSGPQKSFLELVGLHTPAIRNGSLRTDVRDTPRKSPSNGAPWTLLRSYVFIAFVSTIASPFGFLSLSHISFPTLLLGKSCKLVPVMLMNVLLYRRKFPLHKYALVGLVSAGIWAFMAFKPLSLDRTKGPVTNSQFGLVLLAINLLLDGVVNSTQDQVFHDYSYLNGPQMMLFMNTFSTLLTVAALLWPSSLTPAFMTPKSYTGAALPWNALSDALSFISSHPAVKQDMLLFSLTGAVGQLFIFVTLSLYGSLTLVTITVTRKMITMLLSVFVFDHKLAKGQWAGVAAVFTAIVMEAEVKRRDGKQKTKRV